jgi:hypothetical protein
MSSNNTRTRSKGYMPTIIYKTILADRSASMESFNGKQYDMVEHLLNDAKKQALETNQPTHVKFVTFDNRVTTVIDQDISSYTINRDIIEDVMKPSSSTRFNDTLIEQIDSLIIKKEKYLQSLSNEARTLKPDIAMVLIAITDGEDNASRHSMEGAREEMLQFRQNGGRAILMAANMDAEEIGGKYGFNPEKAITVHNSNPVAIESCYRAVSTMARNLSLGIDTSFTQFERATSQSLPQLQGNTGLPQLQRAVAMPLDSIQDDDDDNHPLAWTDLNSDLLNPMLTAPTLTRQYRQ